MISEERLQDGRRLLDEYHGPQGYFELLGKMTDAMDPAMGESVQHLLADNMVGLISRLTFTARTAGMGVELDVYYTDPSAVTALLQA